MIEAIADLGKHVLAQDTSLSMFDIWLEDSFDNGKNEHLFLVVFEKTKDAWAYKGIDYRQNGEMFKSKLLYKRGSSRGSNKTPTGQVSADIGKTFDQRIKGWFEGYCDADFLDKDNKTFLATIRDLIQDHEADIRDDLRTNQKAVEGKGAVLSVLFIDDGQSKFPGDYPFFSRFITEECAKEYKYSKTYKKHSYAKQSTCAVCKKVKDEVFGYFTTLKFYNVDKPGMVSGGFRQDQSWKNYPVCLDCALNIEMGVKVMESDLDYNLYGLRYYLIPKFIHPVLDPYVIERIRNRKKDMKINDTDRNTITGQEEDIIDLVKEEKNQISFNLVFYDKPQKEVFRIITNIEDVLPSRIRCLYDVKDRVDRIVFFQKLSKEGKRIFRFHFGVIRQFFPNDKVNGNKNKSFLQIVDNVFKGTPIEYHYILSHIMKAVRISFIKQERENDEWYSTLKGWILLIYLNELGILTVNRKKVRPMDHMFFQSFEIKSKDEFDEKVALFFESFQDFFKTDAHKGVFLLGVLTRFLLNIQSHERNSTPFRSRLKGLKMDSRDLVGLLPMIIEKLEQYQKNYYLPLETLISKYMVSAGDHNAWAFPLDELNYIFVLGMNLSDYFNYFKKNDPKTKTVTNP